MAGIGSVKCLLCKFEDLGIAAYTVTPTHGKVGVLVRVFIVIIKHHDQKQRGEVYYLRA